MINLINGIILKPKLEEHLQGQDQRPQGGFVFLGGNTGPMGGYGWPGGPPPGQYGNPGQAPGPPGGHQGNPGPPGGHLGNPGQAVPPQQQEPVVQAGPQAGGEVPGETLRSVELPKLDRNATSLDFGDWADSCPTHDRGCELHLSAMVGSSGDDCC